MRDSFESAVAFASDQLLKQIYNRYETQEDTREFTELNQSETSDLGHRILALPDDDIAMLLFRYSFGLAYDEISGLLQQDTIKGKLRYVERILSRGMGFSENESIGEESMKRACEIALGEYAKVEDPVVVPKYSRKFKKKMRELKIIRPRPVYVNVLQKAAIIFIVLCVGFGTALGVNAELRERVHRWFVETFPLFSEFRLETDVSTIELSFEKLLLYRPTFIPEGFVLELFDAFPPSVYFGYINDDGEMLTIIGLLPDADAIALNTEGVYVQTISFRGEDAFFWVRDGVSHFVFVLDGFHFNIFGRIDKSEIVQIAESIEIS